MENSQNIPYSEYIKGVNSVVDIFNEFFGSDRVDATDIITEGCYKESHINTETLSNIIVWFPTIDLTDSVDNHHTIRDLYVKISVYNNGTLSGGINVVRSTYTEKELTNQYLHSHSPRVALSSISNFQGMCVGNGPIKNTMMSLTIEYDEDLWRLFCVELEKYLSVESTYTVPYIKISQLLESTILTPISYDVCISSSLKSILYNYPSLNEVVRDFIRHFCSMKLLKFCCIDNTINIAMSPTEYLMTISNAFIDYYNSTSHTSQENDDIKYLFTIVQYNGVEFMYSGCSNEDTGLEYVGSQPIIVLTFKNRPIFFKKVQDDNTEQKNTIKILYPKIAFEILYRILLILNYAYGNDKYNATKGNFEKVIFL